MNFPLLTPLPWEIHDDGRDDEVFMSIYTRIIGPNGETIVSDLGGICPEDDNVAWTREQVEAHVRLFAVSRELLETLASLIQWLGMLGPEPSEIVSRKITESIERGKAAIARAERGVS